ncbi:MAG: DUF1003 domain-containing protein [Hyphomicrobiaceae bacterium]|nr:DUF1003 domain-containing protein [Hyphomicrobiaceae bacterium]
MVDPNASPSASNTVRPAKERIRCAITGKNRPRKEMINIETVRPSLAERIRNDYPDLPIDAMISRRVLDLYRVKYVEELLKEEHGDLSEIERRVADSLASHDTLAENIEAEYEEDRTFGEWMSDELAAFGGSWMFLIVFAFFLAAWMGYNAFVGDQKAFDSYPFILLNLILSTIAAVQAPIIMMSQKRQEAKDRLRSLNDYQVNLKAELEIRHLHEKMDHLISKQWQRLAEIQQLQLESMQEKRS